MKEGDTNGSIKLLFSELILKRRLTLDKKNYKDYFIVNVLFHFTEQ